MPILSKACTAMLSAINVNDVYVIDALGISLILGVY